MTTITLQLDHWKRKALLDALNDHERFWQDLMFDAKTGKRPNMSIEGAQMFIDDLKNLIDQVVTQKD